MGKGNPYSADDIVYCDGVPMKIRDVPSVDLRAMFGVGHFREHDRQVIDVPGRVFPYTLETCLVDMYAGEWLPDGSMLFCTGCGLDCT